VRFTFRPSFDRSVKSLQVAQKEDIKSLCIEFVELLADRAAIPPGMGLKRLQDGYWEIRKGLRNRILFRWQKDEIDFILAGDHDSIREFLKNV